jgi:hypothetical protein
MPNRKRVSRRGSKPLPREFTASPSSRIAPQFERLFHGDAGTDDGPRLVERLSKEKTPSNTIRINIGGGPSSNRIGNIQNDQQPSQDRPQAQQTFGSTPVSLF